MGILPEHCIIDITPEGQVMLTPQKNTRYCTSLGERACREAGFWLVLSSVTNIPGGYQALYMVIAVLGSHLVVLNHENLLLAVLRNLESRSFGLKHALQPIEPLP